ncbi:hypothetical protein K431DRAFT_112772 [Polychaeton citri CBS 116435]|uniref:Uncharacterized protein n=1 Tax=Polychaeton citri CBS 116435 TaxID=1314669 RepID=A0A9P4UN23_9PEZI|nr:hypothetical protein K431DRAFT_112772 [Polychaeton citri CBS 116435]
MVWEEDWRELPAGAEGVRARCKMRDASQPEMIRTTVRLLCDDGDDGSSGDGVGGGGGGGGGIGGGGSGARRTVQRLTMVVGKSLERNGCSSDYLVHQVHTLYLISNSTLGHRGAAAKATLRLRGSSSRVDNDGCVQADAPDPAVFHPAIRILESLIEVSLPEFCMDR